MRSVKETIPPSFNLDSRASLEEDLIVLPLCDFPLIAQCQFCVDYRILKQKTVLLFNNVINTFTSY